MTGALSHRALGSLVSPGTFAVLVDVDGLIWVNDDRGHVAGDEVLARVAGALALLVQDLVFRVGGDEFLLVLPDGKDALEVGRRAVETVRALDIPFSAKPMPQRVRVEANAIVLRLEESILQTGIGDKGVTFAFRDWFAGLIFDEKTRRGAEGGVVVDARSEHWVASSGP